MCEDELWEFFSRVGEMDVNSLFLKFNDLCLKFLSEIKNPDLPTVMLFGKTGVGKSFLANAFWGSLEPDQGPFFVAETADVDCEFSQKAKLSPRNEKSKKDIWLFGLKD